MFASQVCNRLSARRQVTTVILGVLMLAGCDSRSATAVAMTPTPAAIAQPTTPAASTPASVTPKTQAPEAAKMLSQAFASTAAAVRPSVVRIDVEREVPRLSRGSRRGEAPFFGQLPPPFRRFFNFGEAPDFPDMPGPTPIAGTGSGFVFDASGDIITNSHVVEGGTKFKVTFHDGQEIPAKVVGKDRRTDVALVRLEKIPKNLTAARLGDSNKLQVGEWVLAIGSPLGLDQTVTAGIVSGKGRVGRHVQMSGDRVREYIQTDAKINPGNSGGPLVSLEGEVVGINTLIRVGAGGAYGFAVPMNEAYRIAQLLLKDGRVRYPFLGVNLRDVSQLEDDVKKQLGSRAPEKGAYVVEVPPASPAARVGIKPGDVITKMDDRPVAEAADVVDYISSHHIGDAVIVTVSREGAARTFRAELAEAPSEDTPQNNSQSLGLSLQTLTGALAESLGLPPETRGVAITDVASNSPAQRAGLQAGDVIVEIDHGPVTAAEEAVSALRNASTRGHLLRVRGPRGFRFVIIGGP
jgi:serine protease Do